MDKLLPCPFCGTHEQGVTKLVSVTLGQVAMVECRQCGTLTRASTWNTRHAPEGWQMVPVVITPEMLDAASSVKTIQSESGWQLRATPQDSYTAMLAAAPKWGGE